VIFVGAIKTASATAILDVTEIVSYTQIYQIDIPDDSNYNGTTPDYAVDNSATIFPDGFDRIGYYLELEANNVRQWIWVSMDAFTQDLTLIGVPTSSAASRQQTVNNMNVETNVNGIAAGTGIQTRNIEFWNNCYAREGVIPGIGGDDLAFDFNDDPRGNPRCYGSMQVHNWGEGQTLLAWNRWDQPGIDDVGIGNSSTSTLPDWTFAYNAGDYSIKNLEVWVSGQPIPEPGTMLLLGTGLIGLAGVRSKTKK